MPNRLFFVVPSFLVLSFFLAGCSGCGKKNPAKGAENSYQQAYEALNARKYDEAKQRIDEAIAADRSETRDSALAEDYLLLGYIHRQTGAYDSVEGAFQEAIASAHVIGDKKLERNGKISLAEFYLDLHAYDRADTAASGAVTLSALFSDWAGIAGSSFLDAQALHGLTLYEQEERLLDSLTRIDSLWLDQSATHPYSAQRFRLYRDWGKPDRMRQAYDLWRTKATAAQDTASLIDADLLYGETMQAAGRRDSASHAFTEALTFLDFAPNPRAQIRVLCDLGNLALQASRWDDALRHYRDALGPAAGGKFALLEEVLRLQMVGCEWLSRKPAQKDTSRYDVECERIRGSYPESGVSAADAYAYFLRARVLDRRNQPAAALKGYAQAIDAYDRDDILRNGENECANMIAAFMAADGSDWYGSPISLYCSVNDATGAFELNERRNLYDLTSFFSALPMHPRNNLEADAIVTTQRHYAMRIVAERDLYRELQQGDKRNNERMQKIMAAWPASQTSGGATFGPTLPPALHWLLFPGSLTLRQVQDSLPANAALVEYLPAPNTLFSIIVRHDTAYIRQSAVDRGRITALTTEYRQLCGLSDSLVAQMGAGQVESRLQTLSAILGSSFISPLQPVLGGVSKLYIVQTPEIGWLPVHTLQRGNTPAAKYITSYLPTAAALLLPASPPKPAAAIAGFGFRGATTWDVEYELKDIWSFYREAKMYFDTAATAAQLQSASFDVLHLCVEFTLNTRAPGMSQMTVCDGRTPTGKRAFPLGDFFTIPPSRTVIFSNISDTPGGLYRYAAAALLANGSSPIIATMWQGDRKSKKYFGEVFYTNLLSSVPPDEAYHQSLIKLVSSTEYDSPRQFGVYYLFGK